MKILVVGGGGREHAICWKLRQSPLVEKVFCAPGNAGIEQDAECVNISASDINKLAEFASSNRVDLTVVGPEEPLTKGIVDVFASKGLKIFGPSAESAKIEGSKVFAKELMKKAGIPTADFSVFTEPKKAIDFAKSLEGGAVIKADGLAAGKGVIVCTSHKEIEEAVELIMVKKAFGNAGNQVVVEDLLTGEEASFLAFTDGENVVPLASSQDHKRVFDDDRGPNTGGMGAYSPAPVVTDKVHELIMNKVMKPAVSAMAERGSPYVGVLYAGVMVKDEVPYVLEFNARFGDPETQPLLMRLKSDLVEVMLDALNKKLNNRTLEWEPGSAVCVVMASGGYPGDYEKGKVISGLEEVSKMENVVVFHAGTKRESGKVVTAGGRVLGVTARDKDLAFAIKRAYLAVEKIRWEGVHYRKDIGKKGLQRNC